MPSKLDREVFSAIRIPVEVAIQKVGLQSFQEFRRALRCLRIEVARRGFLEQCDKVFLLEVAILIAVHILKQLLEEFSLQAQV